MADSENSNNHENCTGLTKNFDNGYDIDELMCLVSSSGNHCSKDENCSGLMKNYGSGYNIDATDELMRMVSSTGNHCSNEKNSSGLMKNYDSGYGIDATDELMRVVSSTGNHCNNDENYDIDAWLNDQLACMDSTCEEKAGNHCYNDENCSGLTKNSGIWNDMAAWMNDQLACTDSTLEEKAGNHCNWKSSVVPGFRFKPTDEELFYWYLLPKITGGQIRDGIVKDIDLYKYEPHHLTSLAFDHDDGKMYFFTPLHKKHKNGQRVERETKNGFWKSTQKAKSTRVRSEHGSLVGLKTSLVYHSPKGDKPKKSNWLMQEFRLQGKETSKNQTETAEPSSSNMFDNVVLCVVYKKEGKKKSGTDDENESSKRTDQSDQDSIAPSCEFITSPSSESQSNHNFNPQNIPH
ncbi:NAC domain-containing protein [Quillaja saponaria]|uniref:NAC domain-containing protein n=1 Tax=Quillaja saponaria TaxID=32244 RepID=A0AAD7LCQ0_QUISA|nr:NAC domain-containing protein [Quillaja saponaria]